MTTPPGTVRPDSTWPALYAGLDGARVRRGMSWREVAREASVVPSTLTRLSQGLRPDVDAFARLAGWAGLDPRPLLGLPGF